MISSISTLVNEGGPFMPLILFSALVGYALAVERLMVWCWWLLLERGAMRDALPARSAGPSSDRSPLLALLKRAREVAGEPVEAREQAIHLEIASRLPQVETRIATIGWLGGILPMLGLLGTVSGMIATFKDLSTEASRQVLSLGLSEALLTTEVGLLGAIPLLAVHHLLSRLKARWLNRLERELARVFSSTPTAVKGRSGRKSASPKTGAPRET